MGTIHRCLICMGSNTDRSNLLATAQKTLSHAFPDIRFGELQETEAIGKRFHSPFGNQLAVFTTSLTAEEVHTILKDIECQCGRRPHDKGKGIVRMDIDLLIYDNAVLKPDDLQRPYIRKELHLWELI